MLDPILFWNDVALEAHRRDFTFDDIQGDDELGTPMDRQQLSPRQGGPTRVSRALAIIHLAMYDAMYAADQSVFGAYPVKPFQSTLPTPPAGISSEAAVAGAAAVTIQHLFGGLLAEQALLQFRVILFRAGHKASEVEEGLAFGALIGRSLLDLRARDGSEEPDAGYRPFPIRGAFRPDPYNQKQQIVGPTWGEVTTFGGFDIKSLAFVGPYEALGGARIPGTEELGKYLSAPGWYADLQLVRTKGAAPGSPGLTRTPEETLIGVFWAYDGVREVGLPPRLYNQCLREIATQSTPSLAPAQTAILFALANLAMADVGIAVWHEKYTHHVARPVTGIREADLGFGPDAEDRASAPTFAFGALPLPIAPTTYDSVERWLGTQPTTSDRSIKLGDVAWAPLGAPQTNTRTDTSGPGAFSRSPGFPAYPSGHAAFGATCFEVARRLLIAFKLDPNPQFTFASDEFDAINRDADGSVRPVHRRTLTLAQAIHENAWSRIYLGVHWRMDAIEGIRLGLEVISAIQTQGRGPAGILTMSPEASADLDSRENG